MNENVPSNALTKHVTDGLAFSNTIYDVLPFTTYMGKTQHIRKGLL